MPASRNASSWRECTTRTAIPAPHIWRGSGPCSCDSGKSPRNPLTTARFFANSWPTGSQRMADGWPYTGPCDTDPAAGRAGELAAMATRMHGGNPDRARRGLRPRDLEGKFLLDAVKAAPDILAVASGVLLVVAQKAPPNAAEIGTIQSAKAGAVASLERCLAKSAVEGAVKNVATEGVEKVVEKVLSVAGVMVATGGLTGPRGHAACTPHGHAPSRRAPAGCRARRAQAAALVRDRRTRAQTYMVKCATTPGTLTRRRRRPPIRRGSTPRRPRRAAAPPRYMAKRPICRRRRPPHPGRGSTPRRPRRARQRPPRYMASWPIRRRRRPPIRRAARPAGRRRARRRPPWPPTPSCCIRPHRRAAMAAAPRGSSPPRARSAPRRPPWPPTPSCCIRPHRWGGDGGGTQGQLAPEGTLGPPSATLATDAQLLHPSTPSGGDGGGTQGQLAPEGTLGPPSATLATDAQLLHPSTPSGGDGGGTPGAARPRGHARPPVGHPGHRRPAVASVHTVGRRWRRHPGAARPRGHARPPSSATLATDAQLLHPSTPSGGDGGGTQGQRRGHARPPVGHPGHRRPAVASVHTVGRRWRRHPGAARPRGHARPPVGHPGHRRPAVPLRSTPSGGDGGTQGQLAPEGTLGPPSATLATDAQLLHPSTPSGGDGGGQGPVTPGVTNWIAGTGDEPLFSDTPPGGPDR